MAERLGIGLQNQVQQFDSAWHLFKRMTDDGHPLFFMRLSAVAADVAWLLRQSCPRIKSGRRSIPECNDNMTYIIYK